MKGPKAALLGFVVTAFLSGYTGYSLGVGRQPTSPPANTANQNNSLNTLKLGPDSIIKSQQAYAEGEIIKKDDISITLRGDDGKNITFKLAPNFSVYQPQATASATLPKPLLDKSAIKTNQKATVNLELKGIEYLVTTITYIPE